MDPKKLADLIGYVALVPTAIPIALNVIGTIRTLLASGEDVTVQKIEELVNEALRNHAALPTPEEIEKRG